MSRVTTVGILSYLLNFGDDGQNGGVFNPPSGERTEAKRSSLANLGVFSFGNRWS
jgi:hypothetical protein